jgi:AcrR family transcriptional regulator
MAVMRTHGWSGAAPGSDEEAISRILDAAERTIDERGADLGIADVARRLGVTRQTVYRYFPSTEALLEATAMRAAGGFLDQLAADLRGLTDPAEAVVEGIARTLERLPGETHVGLLLSPGRVSPHTAEVTSDTAIAFGHSILQRFDVDWAGHGIDDERLDELAEHMLRTLQSFIIDPGRPPRTGENLRAYLRRWVAPALT